MHLRDKVNQAVVELFKSWKSNCGAYFKLTKSSKAY